MKKSFLLLVLFLMTQMVCAQTFSIEEVVETSLTKEEMWINLKKWVSSNFNNYKYVVDLEDKENGILIIKSKFKTPCLAKILDLAAESTIQVDVRDNKYRIRFSDEVINIDFNSPSSAGLTSEKLKNMTSDEINRIADLWDGDMDLVENIIKTTKVDVSGLSSIIEAQTAIFKEIPQFKNEKAKQKGVISEGYTRKERDVAILNEMSINYVSIRESIVKSLKAQMVYIDKF